MIRRKHIVLVVLVLIAFHICQGSYASNTGSKKNGDTATTMESARAGIPVIYETDLTLDVDDVGALAVLHGLQMEGKVNILGVSYNEVHSQGPATIDAINTFYNCVTIPIGIYRKNLIEPDPSDYFSKEHDYDVDNMKHDLLSDPEGFKLVKSKVRLLAVMGGLNNDGFNFVRHDLVSQSQYVLVNWPGTLVTTHVGGDMITGETLTGTSPPHNPVRRAYELEWHQGPDIGRCSWDQVTTLYAIYGSRYFKEEWIGSGSGQGVTMTANKYVHIRAALCWTKEIAVKAREHNNANIICLPGGYLGEKEANHIVEAFLNTEFQGGRHLRRIQAIVSGLPNSQSVI